MIKSRLLIGSSGYVDGEWVRNSGSGETYSVTNPATGQTLATLPKLGEAETYNAVKAAKDCLEKTIISIDSRRAWLNSIHQALIDEQDEIGRILCLEHGKPLTEAKGEVAYAASFFKYMADNIDQLSPTTLQEKAKGCSWTVYHNPVGVVGLIVPWNFPIAMIAKKLAPAIAAGCSSVVKPAEETPLTMMALFHLLDDKVSLPRGLVNMVSGEPEQIGHSLSMSEDVAMLSFTGSTSVGRLLMSQASGQVKKLGLELGGNAPYIVFSDANLESAAENLMANKFRGGGQTCVCANRVYVHSSVVDEFTSVLVDKVKRLQVGDGMKDGVDVGPLINKQGLDKVKRHFDDAVSKGAEVAYGDKRDDDGLFFNPTVLRGVTSDMICTKEETFGPLVPIIAFDSDDEALAKANDTTYGLASYVFTSDKQRISRFVDKLSFGHVGVNTGTGPTAEAPFGGMKQSGVGREGGVEGLFEYTETKTVPSPE